MSTESQKFRKKPVVIEAMRWDGTAAGATSIIDWVLGNDSTATYACEPNADGSCPGDEASHTIAIDTLEGTMEAQPGDWIIRGTEGEFYPCKPDAFAATFEAVDE